MNKLKLTSLREKLYSSNVKNIDKNLKNLLRAEKEMALARRIDDELQR